MNHLNSKSTIQRDVRSGSLRPNLHRREVLSLLGLPALLSVIKPASAFPMLDDDDLPSKVFSISSDSVVSIINKGKESSSGSGVLWDDNHIVTNYHVISRVDKTDIPSWTKAFASDEAGNVIISYDLSLSGMDAAHDLAVLEIVGKSSDQKEESVGLNLSPAKISRTSPRVGQYAFAIGNPEGRGKTMTAGIISGLDRSIPSPVGTRISGVLQTDATINGGNSGGGLFDSSGALIGLTTSTYTRSGSGKGSGVNFALPSNLLLDIVPNLIKYGNASGKL